jgi:hypothetical protein
MRKFTLTAWSNRKSIIPVRRGKDDNRTRGQSGSGTGVLTEQPVFSEGIMNPLSMSQLFRPNRPAALISSTLIIMLAAVLASSPVAPVAAQQELIFKELATTTLPSVVSMAVDGVGSVLDAQERRQWFGFEVVGAGAHQVGVGRSRPSIWVGRPA